MIIIIIFHILLKLFTYILTLEKLGDVLILNLLERKFVIVRETFELSYNRGNYVLDLR